MEMTMRWYGKEYDTVTLQQIRQSCYVKGIISTLYNEMPGEVWELDEILALKKDVEDAGLFLAGIESVNVSDAIKTGGPDRDKDIEAYIKTLENLGKADIHMVCYNFMPVFDWTRTELDRMRGCHRQHGPGKNVRRYQKRYERNSNARLGTGTYGKSKRTV